MNTPTTPAHVVKFGAKNMREVRYDDRSVLYSYTTPVAVLVHGDGYYRTERKYSVTTSRHINMWLGKVHHADDVRTVDQSVIDQLASV